MIHWNPEPIIFSIGPIHVRWYGLMFLLGFTIGYQVFKWMCQKENKSTTNLDNLLSYVVAGTIIGARLGHCFFYEPQYFFKHPLEIFAIWHGGLASHGGGAGVLFAIWLFSKRYKNISFFWIIDRAAPLVALAGAFIRIGNLFNSEIIGKPADVPWSFVFGKVDLVARHPTQIYESVIYMIIAAAGLTVYKVFRHKPPQGLLFGVTLAGLFIGRIICEFFKENQEAFEAKMFLNMGQLLSIPYVLAGIYFIWRALRQQSQQIGLSKNTNKKVKKY